MSFYNHNQNYSYSNPYSVYNSDLSRNEHIKRTVPSDDPFYIKYKSYFEETHNPQSSITYEKKIEPELYISQPQKVYEPKISYTVISESPREEKYKKASYPLNNEQFLYPIKTEESDFRQVFTTEINQKPNKKDFVYDYSTPYDFHTYKYIEKPIEIPEKPIIYERREIEKKAVQSPIRKSDTTELIQIKLDQIKNELQTLKNSHNASPLLSSEIHSVLKGPSPHKSPFLRISTNNPSKTPIFEAKITPKNPIDIPPLISENSPEKLKKKNIFDSPVKTKKFFDSPNKTKNEPVRCVDCNKIIDTYDVNLHSLVCFKEISTKKEYIESPGKEYDSNDLTNICKLIRRDLDKLIQKNKFINKKFIELGNNLEFRIRSFINENNNYDYEEVRKINIEIGGFHDEYAKTLKYLGQKAFQNMFKKI